jgi:hypothetical protein
LQKAQAPFCFEYAWFETINVASAGEVHQGGKKRGVKIQLCRAEIKGKIAWQKHALPHR